MSTPDASTDVRSRPTPTHPPTHDGCELFTYATRRWCVSRALELIDQGEAQWVDAADITGMFSMLPPEKPTPGRMSVLRIDIDRHHAATVDLSRPLIVAPLLSDDGDDLGLLVIDGWHRLYRARSEYVAELPVWLLTKQAERAARIH